MNTSENHNNPLLNGVRILDLTRLLPGPFCTLYLAQLGAEVIKIEEPNGGDYARSSSDLFEQVNRGKKSITLDLRDPTDVSQLKALVQTADILIESFRPGVMEKLGCGYETLKAINPRLIYASLTGYGHTGPYKDLAGHDNNYCGYAGVLDQTGTAGGPPALSNFPMADLAGGALTCAVAVLAALFGARASGVGTFVDAAMLDGTLAMQVLGLSSLRSMGRVQPRGCDVFTGALPNYAIYECADGRHLAVGAFEPKFIKNLCEALGRPDLMQLPIAPGGKPHPLRIALTDIFKTKPADEWIALLESHDTCTTPVLTLEEALHNEQVLARGVVQSVNGKPAFGFPVRFDHALPPASPAPALGAHNGELLAAHAKLL